jgi:hypothetical protein
MSCNCNTKYDNKIPCCCPTGPAVIRVTTTTTTTIPPSTTTTTTLPCICLSIVYDNPNNVNYPLQPIHTYSYRNCSNRIISGTLIPGQSVNFCGKQITSPSTYYFCTVYNLGLCSAACTSTTTTTAFPLPPASTTTTGPVTTTTAPPITTTTTGVPINFNIGYVCGSNAGVVTVNTFTGGSGTYQVSDPSYAYTSANAALLGFFISGGSTYTYTNVGEGVRWFAVRDTNNPFNIKALSVNVQGCYITPTTSTTTTVNITTTRTPTTTTTTINPNIIEVYNNITVSNTYPYIMDILVGNTGFFNTWNTITWNTSTPTVFSPLLPGNSVKGVYGQIPAGNIGIKLSKLGDWGFNPFGDSGSRYYARIFRNGIEVCCVEIKPDGTNSVHELSLKAAVTAPGQKIVITLNTTLGSSSLC